MVLRKEQLNTRTQKRGARINKAKMRNRSNKTRMIKTRVNKAQKRRKVNKTLLSAKPSDEVAKPRKLTQTSVMPLNIDFYQITDSVYNSYWVGKLINTLQKEGRKKTAARYVYKAFMALKFIFKTSPLVLFLEILDKAKPNFRLRTYIIRRTQTKEYPVVVPRPRQIIMALHWLKEEIRTKVYELGGGFDAEIVDKLVNFKLNPKKNNLIKKRNEFIKRTIKAQFNTRYNFK